MAAEQSLAAGDDTKPVEKSKILNYDPEMGYRRLGKTGLYVSEIGIGGHWVDRGGRRLWKPFPNDEVPSDVAKNRTDVICRCIERGINHIDPVSSAELAAYRVALKGRRDRMYVSASSHDLNPVRKNQRTLASQVANIEDSLKRLDTDYLDIWRPMFSQDGNHPDAHVEMCVEAFEKAHRQGKVRWLGMSCHNRTFIQHVIEKYPQFAMVIFPYTAASKVARGKSVDPKDITEVGTGDGRYHGDVSKSIFPAVEKHDVGVVTIKPFAGSTLFRTKLTFANMKSTAEDYERARLTLAYILCNPRISATIPGMSCVEQVDNNVRGSAERATLLKNGGIGKLRRDTAQMWVNLPKEYQWLRDWEWV
jgi:predicted aldo/keto reductase-like oxidoreductase